MVGDGPGQVGGGRGCEATAPVGPRGYAPGTHQQHPQEARRRTQPLPRELVTDGSDRGWDLGEKMGLG